MLEQGVTERTARVKEVDAGTEYERLHPALRVVQRQLKAELENLVDILEEQGVHARLDVEVRIKELAEVRRKLAGRRSAKSILDLCDLVAGRVVCHNLSDQGQIVESIQALERFEGKDVRDYVTQPDEGYRAVQVRTHISTELPDRGTVTIPCEIQVRTLIQDAWARISRADFYKPEAPVDEVRKRELVWLSEFLTTADQWLDEIRLAIETSKPRPDLPLPRPGMEMRGANFYISIPQLSTEVQTSPTALFGETFAADMDLSRWEMEFLSSRQGAVAPGKHGLVMRGTQEELQLPHGYTGAYIDLDDIVPGGWYVVQVHAAAATNSTCSFQVWIHDGVPPEKHRYDPPEPVTPAAGDQPFTIFWRGTSSGKMRIHLCYFPGQGEVRVASLVVREIAAAQTAVLELLDRDTS